MSNQRLVKITVLVMLTCVLWWEPKDALAKTAKTNVKYLATKSDLVNARSGPSIRYPIRWVYQVKNEPLLVINEFENWYKVRDFNGDEAWIHTAMLRKKRFAIVKQPSHAPLYEDHDKNSRQLAELEYGLRVEISKCDNEWCKIDINGEYKGYIEAKLLWGVDG